MGIEKAGLTLGKQVIAWTRSGKSLLATKPVKVNTAGLKMAPLSKDVCEFSKEGLLKKIRNNECLQAATERVSFLNKSDDELLQLLKQRNIKEFQVTFDAETFHNDGFISFLHTREKNFCDIPKEKMNEYWEKYANAEIQFYKFFDDILFPVSTNKKVLEIEQKLSKMGIDARLTNHEKQAYEIFNACKKMKERGIENLPKIRVQPCDRSTCSMGIPSKNSKDGYVILGFRPGHVNSMVVNSTAEGITYHETAHVLNNHINASDSMILYTRFDEYFQGVCKKLKDIVSTYAANNPNEACSEIFAGLMSGKKYPKEIIEILEHYKGYNPCK